MTFIPQKDFYLAVRQGLVPGHSLVHKFGRNDAVPNGTWAFVTLIGHTSWPISSPVTAKIAVGGNAADDAAGAGAREITVQGIDSNLDEISEAIVAAGASGSSSTAASWWRIHRAWVSAVGTYGANNVGDIIVKIGPTAGDLIKIAAGEGQSQFTGFSIPEGKTGYLLSVNATVDAGKGADLRLFTRENYNNTTAPMSAARLKKYWDGVIGAIPPYRPVSPDVIMPELTDVWMEARGDGASTEVSADMEILLVDD
ncbi:MAG: hypothetical protein DRJ65_00130 [Acidobacteria bacterium]|nr:MAG: hypothetical protein DRJ65_00130 [Acidobacteriota bacterium]